MGSKYTTLATSGYNTSAPSDAGAQAAENLISWSGIKTKLGDPVKTLADAINTALVSAFDYSVRQITANDTTVAGDHMRCVEIRNDVSTAITISLGDATTMTNLYRVFIKNSSARNQTLTRITGGDTLDGVAGSVVLSPGEGRIVQTIAAATGYVTVSRFGPVTDGDAIVAGGTDGTKKVRIEADGLTTATTRVWTAPDKDITVAGLSDVPAAATQAEQETGSSTTAYVSPGRQQYHASAPKAWVNFTNNSVTASYNVSSVTDNGAGDQTVNLTTAMSSASFSANVSTLQTSFVSGTPRYAEINALAAGSVRVRTGARDAGTNTGVDDVTFVVAFGDQ